MLQTIRELKYNAMITEAYDGNYEDSQHTVTVSNENFPGILEEIKNSLTQKLPNVVLGDDALKVNTENNTLTLKGAIQNLNKLQFTITTDISNDDGLYITVEGLNLTQAALSTLTALNAHAKIFVTEWTIDKVADTFKQNQS
jgi:hypothetical protein